MTLGVLLKELYRVPADESITDKGMGFKLITLDLETTMDHKTIWMAGVTFAGEEATWVAEPTHLVAYLKHCVGKGAVYISAHNGLGFDFRVLKRVWGIDVRELGLVPLDSMILGRLLDPQRPTHALKAYAAEYYAASIGLKGEFTDFDGGLTDEMVTYCLQDVRIAHSLTQDLLEWLSVKGFSDESIWLEHLVADAIQDQTEAGFLLDVCKAQVRLDAWVSEYNAIEKHMIETFPPREVQLKTKVKYIPFNPGSRQQCVERFKALGWVPSRYTKPTATFPKGQAILDDDSLEEIARTIPDARGITRYFQLGKAKAMLGSWIKAADEGGRVHGRVNSNGAVSGRMTHSNPNLAQIPKRDEEIGPLCRELWMVPEGYTLVGVDAKGLELRTFAHYLQNPEYTEALLTGDVHELTRIAAGLPTRDDAKTFMYAFLYGAGDAKLGSIVAPHAGPREKSRIGREMREKFKGSLPGIEALLRKVLRIYSTSKALPGLDGRVLSVRSEHSALNLLLQSAGAIAMKVALVLLRYRYLPEGCRIVVNVHDEWQIECPDEAVEAAKAAGLKAIKEAGEILGMRCPLEGDAKHGRNWHDTH